MYGWMGKIIRVNLTDGTIKTEPLDMQDAKLYMGGRGLGTKLYMNEVDPMVDPLSPENHLIFITGPLTSTLAACSGRYEVVSKAPLTDTIGACSSGGHFGPELKYAGYDGIIFEGKSEKPVYLYINDDILELRDAGHLWGKDVPATTNELVRETDEEFKIACIGPAGEKLVLFAVIMNDKNHAGGRSGLGAVMGSKNLKAIAVRGTKSVQVAKKKEFLDACVKVRTAMKEYLVTHAGLPAHAAQIPISGTHQGCGRVTKTERPAFGEGPGYEIGWSFRSDCGVNSLEADFLCSELGMDPAAMSSTIACIMEMYEKGYIKPDEIGMDGSFGNADTVVRLTEMTGHRDGLGDKLALGSGRIAEEFGHPELSVSVRKQELPAYSCGTCHVTPPDAGEVSQDLTAVIDSAGICLYTAYSVGLPEIAEMFRTCTGIGYTDEEVLKLGERVRSLEKSSHLSPKQKNAL